MALYRGTYYYASRCTGSARPGAKALMSWYLGAYSGRGAANLGIYACKRLGSGYSIHAEGRACDLGTSPYNNPGGRWPDWGWALANALRLNSRELGIQLIIFRRKVWSCRQPDEGWRDYNGTDDHDGHMHVEQTPNAAANLTVDRIESVLGGASPSVPVSGGVPAPTLREGDSGPSVERLQRYLNEVLGLDLVEDGRFGPRTGDAVAELQRRAGITIDRIYGPVTAGALADLLEDDMDPNDRLPFPDWGQKLWPGMADTISVRTTLASGYAHSREAKDRTKAIQSTLASHGSLLEKLISAQSGLTVEDIRAAVAAGIADSLPDPVELAAAIAAELDPEIDTRSLEEAIRRVFGSLDEAS